MLRTQKFLAGDGTKGYTRKYTKGLYTKINSFNADLCTKVFPWVTQGQKQTFKKIILHLQPKRGVTLYTQIEYTQKRVYTKGVVHERLNMRYCSTYFKLVVQRFCVRIPSFSFPGVSPQDRLPAAPGESFEKIAQSVR